MFANDDVNSEVWILLTIVIWLLCNRLAQSLPPVLRGNAIVLAIISICALLAVLDVGAPTYLQAVQPVTFLAGLATVALAVPLWEQRILIRDNAVAMLTATFVSTLTGIGTALLSGTLLGLTRAELASIAPKMTTLAVALPLSQSTGGWDTLTMLAVMLNGIGGVLISEPVWHLFARESDAAERAFALGMTSHAMGISKTMTVSPDFVAFASCGMLLSALMTTILYGFARVMAY